MMNKKLSALLLLASLGFVTENNAADGADGNNVAHAPSRASRPVGRGRSGARVSSRHAVGRARSCPAVTPVVKKSVEQSLVPVLGADPKTYTPAWLPQPVVAKSAVTDTKQAPRTNRRSRARNSRVRDGRVVLAKHKASQAAAPRAKQSEETLKANMILDSFIDAFKDKQNPDFKAVIAFMDKFNSVEEIQQVLSVASSEKVTAVMLQLVEIVSPFLAMASMFSGMQQGAAAGRPVGASVPVQMDLAEQPMPIGDTPEHSVQPVPASELPVVPDVLVATVKSDDKVPMVAPVHSGIDPQVGNLPADAARTKIGLAIP